MFQPPATIGKGATQTAFKLFEVQILDNLDCVHISFKSMKL